MRDLEGGRAQLAETAGNNTRLRENLRDALEQLALAASHDFCRSSGTHPGMVAALSTARVRLEAYCDHLGGDLELRIAQRKGFGSVLSGHLRRFRARQQRELDGIEQLLDCAPLGDSAAHAVHVTALVMLADLDAHARDLELMAIPPNAA